MVEGFSPPLAVFYAPEGGLEPRRRTYPEHKPAGSGAVFAADLPSLHAPVENFLKFPESWEMRLDVAECLRVGNDSALGNEGN